MKRGVDESGIESMGEAGDAYVKGRGNELKMNN